MLSLWDFEVSHFRDLLATSAVYGGNASYLEELDARGDPALARALAQAEALARADGAASGGKAASGDGDLSLRAQRLTDAHRLLGARVSEINPLQYEESPPPELSLSHYGFGPQDEKSAAVVDVAFGDQSRMPLGELLDSMRRTYRGKFVAEFMHVSDSAQREWLRRYVETRCARPDCDAAARRRLLERLSAAEMLEGYLHKKYVGQKRFSLEGGDTLIPLMDCLLRAAGAVGVIETVIGMAHRGRLNMLVNVLGKTPAELFREFEGAAKEVKNGSGDVKYHKGFSSAYTTPSGTMHLALVFNPSHLEIVGPVAQGSVRARQDRRGDAARRLVLPVVIHGDAAFAGQGVVMETLNLSQTHGYRTGGTVHIIVNNQIGFTTSTPTDARSTFFCSDVAKMIEAPIVHFSGDDPESALLAAQMAIDYRQKFGRDIVIDMVCYRRHGHNEQDEPLMTQPLMYRKIARHPGARKIYAQKLAAEGIVSPAEDDKIRADYRALLDAGQSANPDVAPVNSSQFVDWEKFRPRDWRQPYGFKTPMKKLRDLARTLSTLPPGFKPHRQLTRLVDQRAKMAAGKSPLDWGMAENLAYATLLDAKIAVRLSGQDCGRGTFSHRHAVWHDQMRDKRDGGSYIPLRNLAPEQAPFLVIDSLLSEMAVLAFEYGYAATEPRALVVWEAQFGDFANGAQVVIDQFIAAGESKWARFCGLTMLLPHGYEGQGPEHSSARIERYLQLCSEYNIQVCVPSTPAQIYHLLRRQMLRAYRRPLVVITPKSLLRHKEATSSLQDLAEGAFAPILPETDDIDARKVERAAFCAGKIYYEAREERRRRGGGAVAIERLEQLYPFPHDEFAARLAAYPNAKSVVWCQEEPGNQGAWHRIQHYLRRHLRKGQELSYALRPSAASPAAGSPKRHAREQAEVIDALLRVSPPKRKSSR